MGCRIPTAILQPGAELLRSESVFEHEAIVEGVVSEFGQQPMVLADAGRV
jgi:hypothetical protein